MSKKLNLVREVIERLNGRNGNEFANKLAAFLKSPLGELARLISACHFRWVDGNITEAHLPRPAEIVTDLSQYVEVCLGRRASSEAALAHMEAHDLRRANFWEYLLWLAAHPRAGIDYWLVCLVGLAYPHGGHRCVPCAHPDGDGRDLDLVRFGGGWYESDRFLAVRKSAGPSVPRSL